jgi:hypothetical protein
VSERERKSFPQFENIGKLKLTRNAFSEKKQLIFGIFAILTRRETFAGIESMETRKKLINARK